MLTLLLSLQLRTTCRTLAEKMGGTIGFVDNVPHGTVMTLRVPANLHSLEKSTATVTAASVTDGATDSTCWQRNNSNCSSSSSSDSLTESSCELLLRTQHVLVRYYTTTLTTLCTS
jgi:hypothetical protein